MHWRSHDRGSEVLDTTFLKKNFVPYLIAEFSFVKQGENNFTKLLYPVNLKPHPGYATGSM